jgi:transposase, IS30 family
MSYNHLTMDERDVIYRMRFQGYSDAEIARCIDCHRATIGRECKRNASVEGRYDPANAQTLANSRRRAHLRQPKTGHRRLMAYVSERLANHWSPEQIAGRLSACPPPGLEGSQRTYAARRLGRRYRRRQRTHRIPRHLRGSGQPLCDRTQSPRLRRQAGRRATPANPSQTAGEKRRSLTLDNGREFARPIELERKLDLPIYFAHPYHCWERGTNENTNGLLRQYLPKGTDLTQVPPKQLRSIVHALNHRPRKCLDFQSPFEVFHAEPPG